MPDSQTTLRMRLMKKTDLACLVTNRKGPLESSLGRVEVWIPRSQMGTTSTVKDAENEANYPYFHFSLPEWLIEDKNLWEFTTS